MAHYAKVSNTLVTQVIVAEAEFFETFVDSSPGEWIQTSYNTYGGVHSEGNTPLRKNYAGVGYTYDSVRDAFIPLNLITRGLLMKTLVYGIHQYLIQQMIRITNGMKKQLIGRRLSNGYYYKRVWHNNGHFHRGTT